ncbi:MAG: LuxR C-terminal-related transcriptional regulator, partial [Anaerolineae bacterium]|nr:LuxR C-terminal-related transcriptional regulator [Anaerolineae bacterium]
QMFDAILTTFLAIDLNLNGQRRGALAQCEQALGLFQDEHGRPSLLAGVLYVRTGMLLYEANELPRAREFLTTGQQLCEQMGIDSLILLAAGALAALQNAEGDSDAALATLHDVDAHLVPETLGDTGWLHGLETSLYLSRGDLEPALRWAEQAGFSPDSQPEYLRMEELLTYARLLIVRSQVQEARALLERMARFTEARVLVRWQMNVHILQALAAEVGGEHVAARRRLAAVVEVAAPEGYVRAFLDTDARVLDLLPAVRLTAPAFVDSILNAAIRTQRAEKSQPLDEPLSERELEVLRLIAAGLTNAEIADRLVITVGTAKRHINHIYGKLDVRSRTQAVARARSLKLIEGDDVFLS